MGVVAFFTLFRHLCRLFCMNPLMWSMSTASSISSSSWCAWLSGSGRPAGGGIATGVTAMGRARTRVTPTAGAEVVQATSRRTLPAALGSEAATGIEAADSDGTDATGGDRAALDDAAAEVG